MDMDIQHLGLNTIGIVVVPLSHKDTFKDMRWKQQIEQKGAEKHAEWTQAPTYSFHTLQHLHSNGSASLPSTKNGHVPLF